MVLFSSSSLRAPSWHPKFSWKLIRLLLDAGLSICCVSYRTLCCLRTGLYLLLFPHWVKSDSATPRTAVRQAALSSTVSRSLLKLMCIESVMPSTISSSVAPFSFCLQYFSASGSFPVSQFSSDGHRTGASASVSVLPVNIQDWSPLGLTGWISLQSKGLSRVFSNTTVQKHQFMCSPFWTLLWRIHFDIWQN